MRYGNHKITALGCLLAGMVLLMSVGCTKSDPSSSTVAVEPAFRPDGILDFVRPDGSIISRIVIEIAETPSSQAAGLMYRRTLADQAGMLFVFPSPDQRSFWMKNTSLSLDIMFLDEEGTILNIAKKTQPFSEAFISSTGPAQYVVEVRAGYVDKHGIAPGLKIVWERRTFNSTQS